jgi:PAS domain S-box-containing protein
LSIGDSAAPIFNGDGELSGVVLVFRDMERQRLNEKQMEEEVERRTSEATKAEKRYRSTLDNMLEGAQIIDESYKYIYVNDSLIAMAKYPREQLLGHTMMEMYPGIEQSEVFRKIKECMEKGVSSHMENEFTFPDGSSGFFELSIQKVPEGVFILSIDISERKKVEKELKQLTEDLEKKVDERTTQLKAVNAELESFSYSVSHDLRAPLRAIDGYSKILEEDYSEKLDEEGHRIIKVITSNTRQMGQLIEDLLTFSRVGKQDFIKVDLDMDALVKMVIEDQKIKNPGRNINFNVKELGHAQGDHSMMKLVMTNLLSNAIKYSSKKENTEIEIGSYSENDKVVYYIKDNGAGFDMAYYDKLFGVFQRLHHQKDFEGTGVGLALVQRVIFKHGGKVWAEGKENEGATFYFSLPK